LAAIGLHLLLIPVLTTLSLLVVVVVETTVLAQAAPEVLFITQIK